METMANSLTPVMTTAAGSCLTGANCTEVHINQAAYHLDDLLIKPGLSVLMKVPDLKQYTSWSGTLVLNASNLVTNKTGIYLLTSPYDGSKTQFNALQLMELIVHLKPDAVILPPGLVALVPELWSQLTETIFPIIAVDAIEQLQISRPYGVYFNADNYKSTVELIEHLDSYSHRPCYVAGTIDLDLIKQLQIKGISYIESDLPAKDALQGTVYTHSGSIDLTQSSNAMDFELIESGCTCPTCSQNFTKAYLHHLYLHTPLLCQRLLIQHNLYYSQNQGESVAIHLP